MSDACYLSPDANETIKAEDFLEAIQRNERYRITLPGGSRRFFGYCQGCRNKVLHGHFVRDGNQVQYFLHHAALYNEDEYEKMEECGYYLPSQGQKSKTVHVPDDITKAVKQALRANAYGIWRFINSVALGGVAKMSAQFYIETVRHILDQRRIVSGQGFSRRLLPFYVLSQINHGGGVIQRAVAEGRKTSIWTVDGRSPAGDWTYIHFSLLPEDRRNGVFAIRFLRDAGRRRPEVIHELGIPLADATHGSRIESHEAEVNGWLNMTDEQIHRRYPRDPDSILRYREQAKAIRAAIRPTR